MTIAEILTATHLPRLNAELLLAYVFQKPRTWIFVHDNDVLEEKTEREWKNLEKRALDGESIAVITGQKEFYGRIFVVSKHTLIPRPSTEGVIAVTLEFLKTGKKIVQTVDSGIVALALPFRDANCQLPIANCQLVDIGTGSGVIAITLALESSANRIIAIDTSDAALQVAKKNSDAFHVSNRIECVHGDGIAFISEMQSPFIIVSNPPYVAVGKADGSTKKEPPEALFAGEEGLDILLPLTKAAKDNPFCLGIVLEMRENQLSVIQPRLSQ